LSPLLRRELRPHTPDRKARRGSDARIDASQCESGIFLTGTTILDWSANEREFRRYGNRSPYKPARMVGVPTPFIDSVLGLARLKATSLGLLDTAA
jgi:hypothetical protein